VAHYSRLFKIVIDVPPSDHDRELAFWNAVMRDPAGLVFCVIPERPGELNGTNARRWD
jgi:hypothetical protein